MAQTLAQVQKQIEKLQAHAEKLRQVEVKGVVGRINLAIKFYGLTAGDLDFGSGSTSSKLGKSKASKSKPAGKSTSAAGAKYGDGSGNFWSGMGRRPQWLSEALDAGKDLASFLLSAVSPAPAKKSSKATKPSAAMGKPREAKYRDPETGKTWAGGGSQPVWLRSALAAGRSLADFQIAGAAAAKPAAKAGSARGKRAASEKSA